MSLAEDLGPRVDKLENDVRHLQEGQREDDRARGVLANVDGAVTALANQAAELAAKSTEATGVLATLERRLATLERRDVQAQAMPAGVLTNIITAAASGEGPASYQALIPTLVVLVLFYFGPKLAERAQLKKQRPSSPPAPPPHPDANGAAPPEH